jgi:hypothetical protein
MAHVEQELLTLPEHLSSHPVFGGVRVLGFLSGVLLIAVCSLSFGHCVALSFDLRLLINPLGSSNFWSNCRPLVGRSRSRNIILYNMYVWWMILYYILRCYALSWTKQRECIKLNKIDWINDIIIHVLVYQPIFFILYEEAFLINMSVSTIYILFVKHYVWNIWLLHLIFGFDFFSIFDISM